MSNQYLDPNLKVFSLNSNLPLAREIAKVIGVELGKCSVTRFSDGEIQINIEEVFAAVMFMSSNRLACR
jgi:ribose-phosphate pyrophosphokinase